jgi:hypothetical protein
MDARLHEAIGSLLRDDRLASVWSPLAGLLPEALTSGAEAPLEEAAYQRARAAAEAADPSLHVVLSCLDSGFACLAAPFAEGGDVAHRLAELNALCVRAASLGFAAGLEERLDEVERVLADSTPVDPTTGVLRPRELCEQLTTEILRCQRMELPLGLMVIVRASAPEAGGKAEGVGRVLREHLRRYDGVGCLESGEVVAVLPDVARSGLAAAAERVYRRLSDDPRTAAGTWRLALTHLDCVDVPAADVLELLGEGLDRATAGEDYLFWT